MEQTESLLFVMYVCMYACVTQAKTIAVWLMEQTEGLLFVMVCLHVCLGYSSKDYSCLAHGANRRSLVCHVACIAACDVEVRTIAV